MKKLLILAIGMVMLGSSFESSELIEQEESITWYDWNEGFLKARKEGKLAVIDCYTDWCGWCKVMDKKTFTDSAVISKMNEHFIAIKFNPEKPGKYLVGEDSLSGRQLLGALSKNKFSGYPTIFFFVPQNAKMFQHPGYQDVNRFNDILDQYIEYQKGLSAN